MRPILTLAILVLVATDGLAQAPIPALRPSGVRPAVGQQYSGGQVIQGGNGAVYFRSRPVKPQKPLTTQPGVAPYGSYPPGYPPYGYGYYPHSYGYNYSSYQNYPKTTYPVQPRPPVVPPAGRLDPQVNRAQTNGFAPSRALSLQDAQALYQLRALQREQEERKARHKEQHDQNNGQGQDHDQGPDKYDHHHHGYKPDPKAKRFYNRLYGYGRSTFNQSQFNYSFKGQSVVNQNQFGFTQFGQQYVSPFFYNGSVHNQTVYNQSQPNYSLHNVLSPGAGYWRY